MWLRTDVPEIVGKHHGKVYGKAQLGAPPMSVPHLDARVVEGRRSLLFGPYAGLSPRFLKQGRLLDLPLSIRLHNVVPMLTVARDNLELVKYLVQELTKSTEAKFAALREFYPEARPGDWYPQAAGQRAQVIKRRPGGGGVLQFGTEVVSTKDGSMAALLGASPGASTGASIMLEVLRRCFPDRMSTWEPELRRLVPSYGTLLSGASDRAAASLAATAKALELSL